jgi:uncharacterized protein (TIGR00297 family)
MLALWARLLLGVGLSGAIGLLAHRRGSLSRSGTAGAIAVGTVVFAFGGWVWGLLLVAFFASSSLLSAYRAADKRSVAQQFAKGGVRDVWQVLANGGVGAGLAVIYWLCAAPWAWGAFAGTMAAVTGDTWATELGVLSKRRPWLITTWEPVEAGTSGGVSLLGTLAILVGSATIGILAALLLMVYRALGGAQLAPPSPSHLIIPAVSGGMAGAFADSLLGATLQAAYLSSGRRVETEKRAEADGTPNQFLRGWPWVTNDVVNLVSALVGALVGGLVLVATS